MTCKTLALALGVLSVGCGNIRDGNDPGAPIFVLDGRTAGQALADPEGEYRAALEWISVGESALGDCFETAAGADALACFGLPSEAATTAADVAIEAVFPAGFELPIFELPSEGELLDDDGAILAFGQVFVYDDRNANQALDFTSFEAEDFVDLIVGSSTISTDTALQMFLYREGPLHPLWSVFSSLYGCAEPPSGFSVLTVSTADGVIACTTSPDDTMVVTIDDAAKNLGCRGEPPFSTTQNTFPAAEPPADAVAQCSVDGSSFTFHRELGVACDEAITQQYDLEGCTTVGFCLFDESNPDYFNFRSAPPPWWPCDFDIGEDPDECFEGTFTGTVQVDDLPPEEISVPLQVIRSGIGATSTEGGIVLVLRFGPEETEIAARIELFDRVESGDAVIEGTTYEIDAGLGSQRPIDVSVSRRLPGGGLRFGSAEGGTLTVASWSTDTCADNTVVNSGYAAPATEGLGGYSFAGTFTFTTPPTD